MHHITDGGNWTRSYQYNNNDADRIDLDINTTAIKNNQLLATTVGNDTTRYAHDVHGNMLNLPHLQEMIWNYKDQLQQVDLGGGGNAFYVYDSTGQRIRKVIERNDGSKEERLYLGTVEIYREISSVREITKQTDTLHIMDDTRRIAMVDTPVIPRDSKESEVIRYIYSNHLGSSSLEMTDGDQPRMISYEEYHPYGTTAYSLQNIDIKAAANRYRYTGMERDEETGLNYHHARYYAEWVGRWVSVDPIDIRDSLNVYSYCQNDPIGVIDNNGTQGKRTHSYKVKRGDTFSEIAETNNLTIEELEVLNPDIDIDKIKIGQSINLPLKGKPNPVEKKTEKKTEKKPRPGKKETEQAPPAEYKIEILIGDPYGAPLSSHHHGHTAVRITTPNSDSVYDFGRYGKTWGDFDTEGEGILNIWNNANQYLEEEKKLGRKTTGFSLTISKEQSEKIEGYFLGLIKGIKPRLSTADYKRYKIADDYSALGLNCTTFSIRPMIVGIPTLMNEQAKFNTRRTMTWPEKSAAAIKKIQWPQYIWLPMDFKAYLESQDFEKLLNKIGMSKPIVNIYKK